MRLTCGKLQEIIAIAREQHVTVPNGVTEHFVVAGSRPQHVLHGMDIMPGLNQYACYPCRNVMVQKEPHSSAPAICRAISKSISSLWSS